MPINNIITSCNNELIKEISKLNEKKYRDLKKMFIIEGYHLVEMAKDRLVYVFYTDLKDIPVLDNVNYYKVNDAIIKKLSNTMNPQGIVGVCKIMDDNNIYQDKVLCLDNLQDPGNIGTLLRTCVAFGFNDIVLNNECCDIYNDKVIRSSQGAIFNINIHKQDLINVINTLRNNNYCIYGTSLVNGISLDKISFNDKVCIILGNEGNGISKDILNITDKNIYIEINNIESLNVGVAGGIILNEYNRQLRLKK